MQGRHAEAAIDASRTVVTATDAPQPDDNGAAGAHSKPERQRTIRALVERESIGSQQELVDLLNARGFAVTQATVSRDIAELGLIKVPRSAGHAYVATEALVPNRPANAAAGQAGARTDERLRRILADIPVTIARSGLILVITGSPGTASVIAQAIDESSLAEQVGTLAGDNTLLVLFADEPRLLAWQDRFDRIRSTALEEGPS